MCGGAGGAGGGGGGEGGGGEREREWSDGGVSECVRVSVCVCVREREREREREGGRERGREGECVNETFENLAAAPFVGRFYARPPAAAVPARLGQSQRRSSPQLTPCDQPLENASCQVRDGVYWRCRACHTVACCCARGHTGHLERDLDLQTCRGEATVATCQSSCAAIST